jgi:hypothetical protein
LVARHDDIIDRMLGYAQANRRYMKGKLRCRTYIEWTRHRWRSGKTIKSVIVCDPNLLNSYIVAAGSSQPRNEPSVEDLCLLGAEHHEASLGDARGRTGTRMTVRGHYTIREEPFAVQTAAGKTASGR